MKPLSYDVITGMRQSLDDIGFTQDCSLYLAQNDGTLIWYAACMSMYILQVAIVVHVFISRWSYMQQRNLWMINLVQCTLLSDVIDDIYKYHLHAWWMPYSGCLSWVKIHQNIAIFYYYHRFSAYSYSYMKSIYARPAFSHNAAIITSDCFIRECIVTVYSYILWHSLSNSNEYRH